LEDKQVATLNGKTAVVIGGESGIGRAVSNALAAAGAAVRLAGILRDEGAATVDAIRSSGGVAEFSYLDVRNSAKVAELVRGAQPSKQGLDILVYCAGVFDKMANCLETTEALWDQLMDINLKGCFLANKAALEIMVPRGSGRIVNMASIASFTATADGFAYTASKHGMIGMTKHIARSVASKGITANCVCPGYIDTNLIAHSARILGSDLPDLHQDLFTEEAVKKEVAMWVPAGRLGRVDEVADSVLYLVSENSSYITGQSIVIDGGWLTA
jgi:NAD(P)-dependent dehydrogenase (short-subunit alcohol dehydrogenase family)